MIRRKLALYTLLYIAGITSGCFFYDRSRPAEATGFALAVILLVIFSDLGHSDAFTKDIIIKQKTLLVIMFALGFILFAVRSSFYCAAMEYACKEDSLNGRVISVTLREDRTDLTVKVRGNRHLRKVLLTIDDESAEHLRDNRQMSECGSYGLIGADIKCDGKFKAFSPADDPGCFDYSIYMRSRRIPVRFSAYSIEIVDSGCNIFAETKRSMIMTREAFLERFDDETGGLIRGVIFGDKSEIDESILDEFNENSTGHILAVSGLHIGFLYGALRALTSRKRTRAASIIIIVMILLYGEMTMWSPATVRACIVMTVSLCSLHLMRRADLLTSVSFAAFIILSIEPYQLFNSGFQLSFAAICGIAFFIKPISSVVGQTLGTMIAVQIGTVPVAAYTFCGIDPLALFINLPVILLASALVPLCMLLLMTEAVFGIVPEAGISLAELIAYAIVKINHLLNFGGAFSIRTGGMGTAAMITFYITAFLLSSEWVRVMMLRSEKHRLAGTAVLILMPLMMLSVCLYEPLYDDEIVFVAVGQGDCTHIRAGKHNILIDGGGQAGSGDDDGGYNVGENILMPYLLHSGAGKLDLALVTHLHSDHFKGIVELSEIYPVAAVGIPYDHRRADTGSSLEPEDEADKGEVRSAAKIMYIKPHARIDIEKDVFIDVVWPAETSSEPIASDDPNEHNMVYMIHYRGTRILVTGDLLEKDEQDMVEYYKGTDMLKCDILKVAHHGSRSSSCESFLDAASPRIAVIQCSRNNIYGHPHQQTIERLEARGIKVMRTDLSGATGIDIHGGGFSADIYRNTDA